MEIKIIWNGDLELVSIIANELQSKYKMYFYGIQITKDFAVGFIIRKPRIIIDEVDECPNCHFEYQPHWDACPNCKYVRKH